MFLWIIWIIRIRAKRGPDRHLSNWNLSNWDCGIVKRRNLLLATAGLSTAALARRSDAETLPLKMPPKKRPDLFSKPTEQTVELDQGLSGYYVTPVGKGPFPAVLVIMEAFGLNDYIKSICNRLAQAGYAALAPDFYHGDLFPYTEVPKAIAKLKTVKDDVAMAELGKGIEFLAKRSEVVPGGVGVIGFCMGGRFTFLANAAHAAQVKAAVAFYGGGIAAMPDGLGRANLLDQVGKMSAPLMLMYGAEDKGIAPEEHGRIAAALSGAKLQYALNVFPKAGHGFFSDRRDSYQAAPAAEAWALTLSFFERHLKPPQRAPLPKST
jgi:carboxymethylenebutenolidase